MASSLVRCSTVPVIWFAAPLSADAEGRDEQPSQPAEQAATVTHVFRA